ncbi:hypothetical protein Trydic_g10941 [Trypoxylus dichotomus]
MSIFVIVFIFGISGLLLVNCAKYKLCVTPQYFIECEHFNKKTSSIECIVLDNESSCIARVTEGTAHFASVSPEAAFLADAKQNLIALATFKREEELNLYDYQMAIFVNKNVPNGIKGLQNFSYCHPGFDSTNVNSLYLTEFERSVLLANEVDICTTNGLPLIENHIKALNDYLGPSCRPGRWTTDRKLDIELKKKYPKMTVLCNSPSYESNKGMAFTAALDCAINSKNPAVAVTTLDTITNRQSTFNFPTYTICKNGSTSSTDLCAWSGVMHKIIIGNRDTFGDLFTELGAWFSELSDILEVDEYQNLIANFIQTVKIPSSTFAANLVKYPAALLSEKIELNEDQKEALKHLLFPDFTPGEVHKIVILGPSNELLQTIGEPTCAANATNKYYDNQGALDCLKEVGDFAVITVADDLIFSEDVRIMCRNGSLANDNLNVNDNCFLTITVAEVVVARKGDAKNLDIQLMLKESEREFVQNRRTPFNLFGKFNGEPDMLFKDTTLGVELPNSENYLVKNHQFLFRHVNGGSCILNVQPLTILTVTFVIVLLGVSQAYSSIIPTDVAALAGPVGLGAPIRGPTAQAVVADSDGSIVIVKGGIVKAAVAPGIVGVGVPGAVIGSAIPSVVQPVLVGAVLAGPAGTVIAKNGLRLGGLGLGLGVRGVLPGVVSGVVPGVVPEVIPGVVSSSVVPGAVVTSAVSKTIISGGVLIYACSLH